MSLDNQQLQQQNSDLYDELTSCADELSALREALAKREYETLILTRTVSALQDDIIKTFNDSKLEVMDLQNKLDRRVLQ